MGIGGALTGLGVHLASYLPGAHSAALAATSSGTLSAAVPWIVPAALVGGAAGFVGMKIEQYNKKNAALTPYEQTLLVPHLAAQQAIANQHEADRLAKDLEHNHLFGKTIAAGAGIFGETALIGHEELKLQQARDEAAIKLARERARINAGIILPDAPADKEKKTGWRRFAPGHKKEAEAAPAEPIYIIPPSAPETAAVTPAVVAEPLEESKKEEKELKKTEAEATPVAIAPTVVPAATAEPVSGKTGDVHVTINNAPQSQNQETAFADQVEKYMASLPQGQMAEAAQQVQAAKLAKQFESFIQSYSNQMNTPSPELSDQARMELQVMVNKANALLSDDSDTSPARDTGSIAMPRSTDRQELNDITFGRASIAGVNQPSVRNVLMQVTELQLRLEEKARPVKALH